MHTQIPQKVHIPSQRNTQTCTSEWVYRPSMSVVPAGVGWGREELLNVMALGEIFTKGFFILSAVLDGS